MSLPSSLVSFTGIQDMISARTKKKQRMKVVGTADRPRLTVFRSLDNLFAQLINDGTGQTLGSANSLKETGSQTGKAQFVGRQIAKTAASAKIKRVVFDRNGFTYRGVVKILADTARKNGLEF